MTDKKTVAAFNKLHESASKNASRESNAVYIGEVNIPRQPKLNAFSKEVYQANLQKGFDVANSNIGQTLMLVVSELSEALEAHRKDREANIEAFYLDLEGFEGTYEEKFKLSFEQHIKDTFEDEIADAFIRLLDLVGGLEIDIDKHILAKREYNRLRPYKHGKKY